MLGQLESFFASMQKATDPQSYNRTTHEEAELLREAIVEFINNRKWPVEIKDIKDSLEISESSARTHLATLTKQERIKQLSTRPMSWTRK
jgi:predicted ArsR family transcriptional regulator